MQKLGQHDQQRNFEYEPSTRRAGKRVFVIEDDVDLSSVLDRIIRMIDPRVQIDWATSAEEAKARLNTEIKQLNRRPYDLIIADIFLEGAETGLDLWKSCSTLCPDVPIIITSALPVDKYLAKLGVDPGLPPFLAKPFSVRECIQLIEPILVKKPPQKEDVH